MKTSVSKTAKLPAKTQKVSISSLKNTLKNLVANITLESSSLRTLAATAEICKCRASSSGEVASKCRSVRL